MFGTIRKHQKWLWLAIVIPTIITFVWYFGPTARVSGNVRRAGDYGSIDGKKISEDQFNQARREVELHYFFNANGHWPEEERRSGFDAERETYQWLFMIRKQQELGIHVADDIAAEMARQIVRPYEKMGITSPLMFIQRVLQPRGLGVNDFERFIQHFIGIQQLIATVGSGGRLVTPQEARELYQRDHQELATEAVFFTASNYLAEVPTPTPAALGQYYTNMMVRYAIPDRVQVSYVRFNVTNFLPEAEAELKTNSVDNLADMVDKNYQRIGTNAALIFPDAKTPDEIKARIREELVRKQAMATANKKAVDFANQLFDMTPANSQNLQLLAATNGLKVEVSQPFDREEGPTNLDVGQDFTKRAFALSLEEPFTQPTAGRDGIYIAAFDKQLPRETPTLEQIRDRVVTDYKHSQAVQLAQQAARGFYQTLTNGLEHASSFTNLCAAARIKPASLPPFSLATRELPQLEDLVSLNQLKQAAFTTRLGKVSSPHEIAEGSFLLYVGAKLPVDQTKMQADMPNYIAALRRNRQQEAFEDWFRREADRGLRDTPLARPKTATGSSGAPS